jgi:hypothetical protein
LDFVSWPPIYGIGRRRLSPEELAVQTISKKRRVETYPIDVEREQLVRLFIAERQGAVPKFEVVASCFEETRDLSWRKEFLIGNEVREDVHSVVRIATLKITPIHRSDGWSVSVVIEDDFGAQAFEDDEAMEEAEEEEIDVDAFYFYNEFILPGRGSASLVAEFESLAAKQRLSRLLGDIVKDRHGKERDGSRRS